MRRAGDRVPFGEKWCLKFLSASAPLPTMKLDPAVKHISGFKFEDITREGYDPHLAIIAPVPV